jgi:hypothetical protein
LVEEPLSLFASLLSLLASPALIPSISVFSMWLEMTTVTGSCPRWGTLCHFVHSTHVESQVFVLSIHE